MKRIAPILILLFYGFALASIDISAAAADRMVKVVYFVPRDRPFQWNIPTALDTRIKAVQHFYAEQMEAHGHGRKTFNLENDAGGKLVVYPVTGNFNDAYYHTDTLRKITDEIDDQYDIEKDIYIVIVDVSTERIQGNCGIAYFDGGPVMVAATGDCVQGDQGIDLIAHELGHALNLEHDFRNESYIMSYGATRDQLSSCAAAMLNVSPFFNNVGNTSNTPASIQMLTPSTYPANEENWALQFDISDADGVYQVQFLLSVPGEATSLFSCQNFNNIQNTTVEFNMPAGATVAPINNALIRVVDPNGYITAKDWTLSATKTINTDRTETYLTLNYDSLDALVPINNSAEWGWDWGGWPAVWEKKPNGSIPEKPHQGFVSVGHIPYINQWDYWFYAHVESHIVYDLSGGDYAKFDAYFDMPNPCESIASVEVIFLADGIEIYNSGVLRGAQTRNTKISFDIPAETQTLTIHVIDAGDGGGCDHFIFANAKLLHREPSVIETIDTDRTETYLTLNYDSPDALVPTNGLEDWVNKHLPSGNRLIWEKTPDGLVPRRPNGFMDPERSIQFYDEWDYFFYSHAQSRIVYHLGGRNYTKFDAYFDMPNPCGSIASVEVIFLADGIEIYNSGVLRGAQTRNTKISFDIPAGTQTFTINVTDAGDGDGCDHFIFANARLLHGESFVPEKIKTEITDTETTKTYLTLAYNSTNALVPTNYATEWTGWKEGVWEKTPDGQYPPKPQGFVHTPYIDVWDHWIYAHAYSRIDYNLSSGNYTKFDAYFLMPNPCGSIASVEVICLVDGAEIYNSGVLRGPQVENKKISFNIPANTRMLTIRVTEAGDGNGCDHFVLGNPHLSHGEPLVTKVNNYTDVNNDGFVNIIDLVLVAARYGEKIVGNPHPNPDVNRDGIVDVDDIILITKDMPPVAGAPTLQNIDWQHVYNVLPDIVVEKGIVVLDLLFGTVAPTKTMLLENYPNPFNPETWIPYQLAMPTDVVIAIHAVDGQVVRKLEVGHQDAGRYVSRSRAAYWDGKNGLGEPVASGLYFYTLTAGEFVATRRMLIRK